MGPQPILEQTKAAEAAFEKQFGRKPRWLVAAPGRVNLIGEHTDYNDGFVFPMAIERRVVIAADRPATDASNPGPNGATVYSTGLDERATLAVEGDIQPGQRGWTSYVQGVIAGCLAAGLQPGPFEAVVFSDVPLGGGLSSSAALEVATATLIETMVGRSLDPVEKVLLCQKAEHDFAGMPCGIMDQFSSVMGQQNHLMLLDCRAQAAEMVPLESPELTVLITNSNVKHELTGSEYPQRRAQCHRAAEVLGIPALRDATIEQLQAHQGKLDEVEFRRARHVVTEIERTVEAALAMRQGNWDWLGELMYASHASLRDDYEVSCTELDLLVEISQSLGNGSGIIGSRMTGGGFGGCTVSLVRSEAVADVTRQIQEKYEAKTGIAPTIFASRPAQGACVIRRPED